MPRSDAEVIADVVNEWITADPVRRKGFDVDLMRQAIRAAMGKPNGADVLRMDLEQHLRAALASKPASETVGD